MTIALAASTLVFASAAQAQEGDGNVTISLLHNNDGESKLLPGDEFPGIARFVEKLQTLQADLAADAAVDGVVTLTSGDNFLASKEFNASLDKGAPYYDSIALSGLYDAMALGNHDFDFGPEVAAAFVSGFNPAIPFLSANADFAAEPTLAALVTSGRIARSTVIDVAGTKVGVIGAITPLLPSISSPRGVVVRSDVAGAVNAEAAALEAQGVNKIVLISHLQGLSADQALIPLLSGVDVAIAGGGDELLANAGDTCATLTGIDIANAYPLNLTDADGNTVPVVTGPGGYRCIGRLDVTFDAAGAVVTATGSAIGVELAGPTDATVLANVETPVTAAVAAITADVIGTSEVALDGTRSAVRTTDSNEAALLADALLDAATRLAPAFGQAVPDIAIQNGGGIRNDAVIPAGNFTTADTFDIAPFSNFVEILEVPRATLKELLEVAVSRLPDAGGQFAQPAGFSMTVDITRTARAFDGDCAVTGNVGERITDVTLDDGTKIVENGQVLPGGPVRLAIVNFLANGGDCYPLGDLPATSLGITYQQALADYVTGALNGVITAAAYPAAGHGRTTIIDGYGSGQIPTPTPVPPTPTPVPPAPTPTAIVIVPATPTTVPGNAFGFGDRPNTPDNLSTATAVPTSTVTNRTGATTAAQPPLAVTGDESTPFLGYAMLLFLVGGAVLVLGRRVRLED